MSEYPEHDKLAAISDASQAIGQFLEASGFTLCKWDEEATECPECDETIAAWLPVGGSISQILAEHFGIDLDALEAEKRAMLDRQRELIASVTP